MSATVAAHATAPGAYKVERCGILFIWVAADEARTLAPADAVTALVQDVNVHTGI